MSLSNAKVIPKCENVFCPEFLVSNSHLQTFFALFLGTNKFQGISNKIHTPTRRKVDSLTRHENGKHRETMDKCNWDAN